MKRILSLTIVICCTLPLLAQREASDVRQGNRQYNRQNFTEAEVAYRRGLHTNNQSYEAHYNLGNALFRQEKYAESLEEYQAAASLLDKKTDKERYAQAMHNMGNAFFAQQQYDKAVAAYKEALRHQPKDDDTRYNLVKAMQMLQQQQNQNQNQNQNQQEQQQQEQQQQQQQQEQQQQQQQQEQEQQMDKETAEQILQALEQDEQDTQDKLQRTQGQKRRVEKDW